VKKKEFTGYEKIEEIFPTSAIVIDGCDAALT